MLQWYQEEKAYRLNIFTLMNTQITVTEVHEH